MEKYEEMFEKIYSDPKVGKKIDELEAKYVPVQQLIDTFGEVGIEADETDVKEFIAYRAAKRFEMITNTELDEEMLKQVAGGDKCPDGGSSGCSNWWTCYNTLCHPEGCSHMDGNPEWY